MSAVEAPAAIDVATIEASLIREMPSSVGQDVGAHASLPEHAAFDTADAGHQLSDALHPDTLLSELDYPVERFVSGLAKTTGMHEGRHYLVAMSMNVGVSHVEVNSDGTGFTRFAGPMSLGAFNTIAAAGGIGDRAGAAMDHYMIALNRGDISQSEAIAAQRLNPIPGEVQVRFGELLAFKGRVGGAEAHALLRQAWREYILFDQGEYYDKQVQYHQWQQLKVEAEIEVKQSGQEPTKESEPEGYAQIVHNPAENMYTATLYDEDDGIIRETRYCTICGGKDGYCNEYKHAQNTDTADNGATAETSAPSSIGADELEGSVDTNQTHVVYPEQPVDDSADQVRERPTQQ